VQDCFEIILLVIDDDIGAEALDQIGIRRARCRRNRRAKMFSGYPV
jgi:DNA-directed RNA polymerase subunit N (RpoN/RPB10)